METYCLPVLGWANFGGRGAVCLRRRKEAKKMAADREVGWK